MRLVFIALTLLFAGPAVLESVKVKTKAPSNAEGTVYYRVPKDYNPDQREAGRILVLFGERNSTGSFLGSDAVNFGERADPIFLGSPYSGRPSARNKNKPEHDYA